MEIIEVRFISIVVGLALLTACAAPLDPATAPPLRMESYVSGPASPLPGKPREPITPMERIERRLSVLYPPGTDIVVVREFLELSGIPCIGVVPLELWEHCIYGEYEPTTPRYAFPDIWWVVRIQHELFGPWVHSYVVFAIPHSEVLEREADLGSRPSDDIVMPAFKGR